MLVCAAAGQVAGQGASQGTRQVPASAKAAARASRLRLRRPMGTPFTNLRLLPRPAATVARVTKEHDGAKSKARSQLGSFPFTESPTPIAILSFRRPSRGFSAAIL